MSDFLRRWSDRKAKVQQQEPAAISDPAHQHGSDTSPEDQVTDQTSALPPEELAARIAELPPIDLIDAKTDIRPFLQDFVPAALRKLALRKAWLADPVISTHLDIARDYAWDFNAGHGPGGFYRGLAREVAQRGLAALEDKSRTEPEPETPATIPPDTSFEIKETPRTAALPLDGMKPAETSRAADDSAPIQPAENPSLPLLKQVSRHGGALPD